MTKVEQYKLRISAIDNKDVVVIHPKPQNKSKEKKEIKVKHSEVMETKKFESELRESIHQCKICNNNFKSINNLKNHEAKFHSQETKCTIFARTFENSKTLETHITSVYTKSNTNRTLERNPSLANHKQKKV